MTIGAIPVFVAVAENGGFAAAARQLGVSKSAVSKRISQLEAELGAQLLHRSTRSLSLTEAGERYLSHAVRALGAAREAEDAVLELQGDPKGLLKISVPMSFGRLHVAPLLSPFLRRHPGIEIDMVMDDRVTDLVEGGFDMAIRAGTLPDTALIARKLAPCCNILCAAPAYVDEFGKPEHPTELPSHNCLHYAYFSDASEWTFASSEETVRVAARGNLRINNGEALLEAVLGGAGIARLPSFIAGPHLATGKLQRLLCRYDMPAQTVYAVFPKRRHRPAKVGAFLDFLVTAYGGGNPPWDAEL